MTRPMKRLPGIPAIPKQGIGGPNLYTYIAIAAMLGIMTMLTLMDLSEFLPFQTKDAETVANMAERGVSGDTNSYKATALVYSLLSPTMRAVITYGFGSAFIIYCLAGLRKPLWLGVMCFMLISPMIFYLTQFNKDTVLIPFLIIAAITTRLNLTNNVKIGIIFTIYVAYTLLFRPYYVMIGGIFVGLYVLSKLSIPLRTFLIFSAFMLGFLLPDSIFDSLQSFRDVTNARRLLYGSDAGARTAFMNLVEPDSYWHFLVNYVYAFLRLNLPFLFDFNVKDLILVANILILIYVFGQSFRSRLDTVRISFYLFTAHFLVLQIFEPDLGTYFRHISVTLLFSVPAFVLAEQQSKGMFSRSAKPRRNVRRMPPRPVSRPRVVRARPVSR